MIHSRLQDMLEDMIEHPNDLFIKSNSQRSALVGMPDGSMVFLRGDFSGSDAENEAEARRILNQAKGRQRS